MSLGIIPERSASCRSSNPDNPASMDEGVLLDMKIQAMTQTLIETSIRTLLSTTRTDIALKNVEHLSDQEINDLKLVLSVANNDFVFLSSEEQSKLLEDPNHFIERAVALKLKLDPCVEKKSSFFQKVGSIFRKTDRDSTDKNLIDALKQKIKELEVRDSVKTVLENWKRADLAIQ